MLSTEGEGRVGAVGAPSVASINLLPLPAVAATIAVLSATATAVVFAADVVAVAAAVSGAMATPVGLSH
jgi:hypothetical protein